MFGSTVKDIVTNICAFVVVVAGAVNAYFQTLTDAGINYPQLILAVVVAVIGYFTGKQGDGASKPEGSK